MLNYQELLYNLSTSEVDFVVDEMIRIHELTGKYYNSYNDIEALFSLLPKFKNLVEQIVQKEYHEYIHRDKDILVNNDIFPTFSITEIEWKNAMKNSIYLSIFDYLKSKAHYLLEHRDYQRLDAGDFVDYKECQSYPFFNGKIEFYKDGGWGIGDKHGMIIVSNHLMDQPSKTFPLISHSECSFRIIQDKDTHKYGVLSYESFYETIHCLYDKIEILDSHTDSVRNYFIKVMRNGKWGCFDENCALVVDCKYDEIFLREGFLECIKDAEYLSYETLEYDKDTTVVTGKKDLYNKEGLLLIGGYDNLDVNYGYMQFYFGTYYEEYYEEETDYLDNQHKLLKLRLNYNESKCLILDNEFKTIIRSDNGFFRMPKGIVFESVQEIEKFVPFGLLFKYRVDLSHFDKGFIYLHDFYGKQYLVPEYIAKGFDNQEIFEDDEIVTIIKIDKEMRVEWHDYVNEVGLANYTIHYYRVKDKIGVFDEVGLHPAVYDAITWDSTDMDTYVASFEFCESPQQSFNNNPNFRRGWYFIHFNKINNSGTLIRMADDWNIFDPTKQKWFPYDFIARHYDVGCSSDYHTYNCSEYTDEDAWDAMTDGMYGDYPGSGWDPEAFGY